MKGLLPRSVEAIFERISSSPNYLEFRIKVSMIEIYMEKIRDLLDPAKTDLKIR
jgi:kinesin family member 5